MKMSGQVTRFYLGVSLLCLPLAQSHGQDNSACEQVVVDENQLAGVFGCDTFCLPVDPPRFQVWLLYPQFLWTDFGRMPKEFSEAFAASKEKVQGVTVLKLRLTRPILTGETIVQLPSGSQIIKASASYDPEKQDWATRNALKVWKQYIEWGELDQSSVPTLSLSVTLADVRDRAAYEKSLADEADSGSGVAMLEAESSTSITNVPWVTRIRQNADGSIGLTWNSETNGLYDIYYTQDLVTQSWKLATIQIPNQGTLTQWSDYGGPGRSHPSDVVARFYRVGLTLDSDGDGLPDAYELLVSNTATNVFDTNGNDVPDGEEDFDGDGVLNVGEYSLLTSPYLADSDGDGVSDGPNATNSIAAGPDAFFDSLVRGKIRGDNQVGSTSQPLLIPFVVYLTGTNGAPVANGSNVTFTASYPSGADASSLLSNTSDATGNNGFAGQAQTFLTLGNQTGTYKVVAHCGNMSFEFRAETITPLSLELTDGTYQPSSLQTDEVVGAVAHIRVTVSGTSSNVSHVLGVKLTSDENSGGIVVALYETTAGSGIFVGSAHTEKLQPGGSSLLSLPSPNANPAGGNSKDDGVAETASGDDAIGSGSNFSDSDTYDDRMSDYQSRGKARAPLPIPQGAIIFSKSFMKAGGFQRIVVFYGSSLIKTNYFENQADFLYFSGHGYHDDNFLDFTAGEFRPSDVSGGQWKKDLEIVILAGCSVLDVTGDKWPSSNTNRPGKAWAKLGPTYLLGYEAAAPPDNSGVPSTIIGTWWDWWYWIYEAGDPIPGWGFANEQSSAWNACAIDCSVSPKIAWHFTGTIFHSWDDVPENQW